MRNAECGIIDVVAERVRLALGGRKKRSLEPESFVPAAVLICLFRKGGTWRILFSRRTENVKTHKGQISFPGGVIEAGDGSPLAAALRESEEEVGIRPQDVEVLGELDDYYTITGFVITPFAGRLPDEYPFNPSRREVQELIEAELEKLLDPGIFEVSGSKILRGETLPVYAFQYGEHCIWGATAAILAEFLRIAFGWNADERHE